VKRKQRVALIAQRLAAKFLEAGNYTFSAPLSARGLTEVISAAADTRAIDAYFEETGFAGLAVQSVGYEEGAENPKVHIYVTRGPRKLEREIPEEGVPIEINRVGRVVIKPEAASAATNQGRIYERHNRVACGSSCAPSGEQYAGTLGAFVRKRGERDLYILSNNHVLAAGNHVPVGMPILAPSPIDARPGVRAPGEVGRHSEICELRSGVPTLVPPGREDIALARVPDVRLVSSWQGEGPDGYDTPTASVVPSAGLRVKKFGRTTGLTTGFVEALVNTPFPIPYRCRFFSATVWFQEVWTVKADPGQYFALPGDSGSLVVKETGEAAVGLVFAATPQGDYGFIIPVTHIVTLLGGLTLVGGHGVER
jgi:hypothetical protein